MPEQLVKNQQLSTDVARPNHLQNGGFEVWNRGPGAFTSNNIVIADAWFMLLSGGSALTVTRETGIVDVGSAVSLKAVSTYSSGPCYIGQNLARSVPQTGGQGTALDYQPFAGRTMTFSARVFATTANAVRLNFQYNGNIPNYSPYHPGDGTWRTLSVTVALPTTLTSLITYFQFDASCTVYLDNVALVVGSQYMDYVPALDLPDSIPNERLATDVNRVNWLVDGGFEWWNRGGGPFTVNATYTADRWLMNAAGTDSVSISADNSNIDSANGSRWAMAMMFTLGTGNGASGIYQRFSFADGHMIRNRTFAHSMRVRTSVPNGIRINLFADGTGSPVSRSDFCPGDNQWHTLTAVMTVPYDATYFAAGVNLYASGVYYLDSAMVVPGTVACDYVPIMPADEVNRCNRYYERLAIDGDATLQLFGFIGNYGGVGGSSYLTAWWPYKATKPSAPTVSTVGTWGSACSPAGGNQSYNGAQAQNIGVDGIRVAFQWANIQSNPPPSGSGANIYTINNGAGSNIVVEANP